MTSTLPISRCITIGDGLAADTALLAQFNNGMLERGILKGWPQKFYPSLAHTDADVEQTINAFREVAATISSG